MKRIHASLPFLGGLLMLFNAAGASASLTTFQSFSGNVGLSVNGGGSTFATLPNGLTTDVPAGSTVIGAYLYTSTWDLNLGATGSTVPYSTAGVTLNGNPVTFTALPANASADLPLQAGVANVTSIVQSVVNPGGHTATGGVYNFGVTETNTAQQDGEVLVVVYSNPTLPTGSVGILDGAASSSGDSSSINFASNPSGSTVLMSVGDGFSYDLGQTGPGGQESTITVDGSLLTSAAGNCDASQDGGTPPNPTSCNDGDLITAGQLGLNANGSVDTTYSWPFTTVGDTDVSADHELYNISSLINPADGNTISLTTFNESHDDNIFLEAFYVNGIAGFNAPPPSGTPEPASLSLLLLSAGAGVLTKLRARFTRR